MKIGIIAKDKNEWHVKNLTTEIKRRDIEIYIIPITKFLSRISEKPSISVKGFSLDDYDALIVRRVPGGSLEQVFYRMDSLHTLEDLGVKVINSPGSIEKAVNKYYTSAILEREGISTPKTIVTESFKEALDAFSSLGGDVIVKPLFGSLGMGITRITNKDIAYRVFRALEMMKSVYYIQEYIPHGGKDIRTFIIGERVVASMIRASNNWKTNISSGGKAKPFKPDKYLEDLSINCAKALGLSYTGVDIIQNKQGINYVIELNSTPGWKGLQSVTNVNITKTFIDYIIDQLE